MDKHLKYKEMLKEIGRAVEAIPEHRRGENRQYELRDAGLSAFSVFHMQEPSFLAWQEDMEKKKRKEQRPESVWNREDTERGAGEESIGSGSGGGDGRAILVGVS